MISLVNKMVRKTMLHVKNVEARQHADEIMVYPPDFSSDEISIIRRVQSFTMTSPERIIALIRAVEYIVKAGIDGDIVECGVWKGGSMMAVAETLRRNGDQDRHLYLFDTFDGMTVPSPHDLSLSGESALDILKQGSKDENDLVWAYAPVDQVREAVMTTNYDSDKVHFIVGRVEETVPAQAPDSISLLRLDTDWYESTYHELTHLFPRLSPGGVLVIDDYGHWQGARKAVDEYFETNNINLLLSRIDYTGRIGVKR